MPNILRWGYSPNWVYAPTYRPVGSRVRFHTYMLYWGYWYALLGLLVCSIRAIGMLYWGYWYALLGLIGRTGYHEKGPRPRFVKK